MEGTTSSLFAVSGVTPFSLNEEGQNSTTKQNGAFGLSGGDESDETGKHHRLDQYKSKGKSDQERRREYLLERQKQKRSSFLELARSLAVSADEEAQEEGMDTETHINGDKKEDSMEVVRVLNSEKKKLAEERRIKFYQNQLMMPEFLSEIPLDLVGGWYAVPFPPSGKRCLVIAVSGSKSECSFVYFGATRGYNKPWRRWSGHQQIFLVSSEWSQIKQVSSNKLQHLGLCAPRTIFHIFRFGSNDLERQSLLRLWHRFQVTPLF